MRKRNDFQVAGLVLGLFMVGASPSGAQTLGIDTLLSPNEDQGGWFGWDVSPAGDVNQDGITDVIVGARLEDPDNSPDDAGRAYVFSGQAGSLLFELKSPNEQQFGQFGYSVSGAGDVNKDGIADVIVGAPGEDPGTSPDAAGRAYVFSGQDASLIFELKSPNEEQFGSFGWSASDAGDVNQDGNADVIVGSRDSPGTSPDVAGRAYIFSGQDGSLLFELMSPNEEPYGHFGNSVASAGDVNQDGNADLIVGALLEDPGTSPEDAGRAYLFSGRDGSLLFELMSPNEEPYPPPIGGGIFGESVAGAGDVNQDGFPDVIVGASNEGPDGSPVEAGRAYLFSGQDGSLLFELMSPNEELGGFFGRSVSAAGDVNQDGFPDVIVGAEQENPGTSPSEAGRAYVFSGQDGSLLSQLVSPNEESDGFFGFSVSGAGDVNQDGFADVIVGALGEDPGTSPDEAGRAYIFVPNLFRINGGGPKYTDTAGSVFVTDQAYATGSFGYVGGSRRRFSNPIGGTQDDPLYQDLRLIRTGSFIYRFDVASAADYDVTLHLMAPGSEGAGNIVMDVKAEGAVVLDDLDVTAEAGGTYQALVKSFAVNVTDGTLDLEFVAVNKAALVSAIGVAQQIQAR